MLGLSWRRRRRLLGGATGKRSYRESRTTEPKPGLKKSQTDRSGLFGTAKILSPAEAASTANLFVVAERES